MCSNFARSFDSSKYNETHLSFLLNKDRNEGGKVTTCIEQVVETEVVRVGRGGGGGFEALKPL